MKTTLAAGLVCLAITSGAQAQQAVQWRVEDGGNGHWYGLIATSCGGNWQEFLNCVEERGGNAAAINSAAESEFISLNVVVDVPGRGALIGAYTDRPFADYPQSATWIWSTGEPWTFTNWCCPTGLENHVYMFDHYDGWPRGTWDDCDWGYIPTAVVEWSADCNNDGIVDYGQILQGQLADNDVDGIPDICEVITCHDSDLNLNGIVDGGDLGVLLAFWGTVSPAFPRADINRDGVVNGADLGLLLAFWGPCPN